MKEGTDGLQMIITATLLRSKYNYTYVPCSMLMPSVIHVLFLHDSTVQSTKNNLIIFDKCHSLQHICTNNSHANEDLLVFLSPFLFSVMKDVPAALKLQKTLEYKMHTN